MSCRSTRTNKNDVAVAKYRAATARNTTIGKVLVALITAVAAVGTVWSIDLQNNTVIYAPRGSVALTSGEMSADAGTLPRSAEGR